MTKTLLSVAVFIILLSHSALVPALNAAPADSTPAVELDVDSRAAVDETDFDQAMADAAASAIRRYSFFDVFGWVTATAEDGVVTLDGTVREPFQRSGYEAVVARVSGVARVVNKVEVLPLSAFDDQIRRAAVGAIYDAGTLRTLMRGPNPPIHVIVANGTVRLEGVVRNEMDRILAEIGVRNGTMAFEIINNLQVESS